MTPRVDPVIHPVTHASRWLITGFAATIFLSAFLLFQVQPLLSKVILPWFGGSPAVWTAAMLFFQLVLLAGYLYAHLLSSYCTRNQRLVIHLSLLVLAAINVAYSRLTPPQSLRPQGEAGEAPLLQTLLLLGVTVGLPYFTLSSTGPLLQRWFHDALPGVSPYRLFALSNFGSLVALVSFPFFFEIHWGVTANAQTWTIGFVIFAVCCAVCAVWTWQLNRRRGLSLASVAAAADKRAAAADTRPRWWQIGYWLGLSTLASVTFLAVTNEVCQNVASVPLLWVIPLSLYLLSFIVAFDHSRWYSRRGFAIGVLLLVAVVAHYEFCIEQAEWLLNSLHSNGAAEVSLGARWWLQAACYFLALFLIATMCHGELAQSRPQPEHLTSFYLTMSIGGALGGLLVNLAAPYVFTTFFEFSLALLLSALAAAGLVLYAASGAFTSAPRLALGGVALGLAAITVGGILLDQLPGGTAENKTVLESRNFYGVVSVMHRAIDDKDENYTFFSGNIQHGKQLADPARRATPLTYYGEGSGCERALQYVLGRQAQCRIGVVGLGVGTIATYARRGDSIRLYEINPEVIHIAKDTRWFHFLSQCACQPEIVLGDARVQLERELRQSGSQQFDVLVIDAFSGDSVPTHLLTREAFDVYRQHLAPNGMLVLHITNTHLDLYPVVSKLADHFQFGHRRFYRTGDEDRMLYRNYYLLVTRDQAFLDSNPSEISDLPEYLRRERKLPIWTDDYTNLTSLLR